MPKQVSPSIEQLPVITGRQDAPLAPQSLAEAICIAQRHAPHRFQTPF